MLLVGVQVIIFYIHTDAAHSGQQAQMLKCSGKLGGIRQTPGIGVIGMLLGGNLINNLVHSEDIQHASQASQFPLHRIGGIVKGFMHRGQRLFFHKGAQLVYGVKGEKSQREYDEQKIDPYQFALQGAVRKKLF